MLILGIDTATPWGTMALHDARGSETNESIFEISFKTGKGGGEYLFTTVGTFIKKAGRKLAELDLIAAGTGPGSYTGIRVGLAAVKGLAEGLQKPVFGVNTLRIIAENARYTATDYIAAVIDARHGEVYAALYEKAGGGLKELAEPRMIAVPEFAAGLAGCSRVVVCGDGSKVYQEIWNNHKINIGPCDWDLPSAGKLVQIASSEWNPNYKLDLAELKACYLRRVEAEIRLEEKLHAINLQPHED